MPDVSRLVLAHGFTQTARSWDISASALRVALPGAEIVSVDMPGHGAARDVRADLWESAQHLVDVGGESIYVGYSMGGRVALHAALAHGAQVQGLVLIGATAGIQNPGERATRRAADERLATHIEEVGVAQFIDEWLANPLFAGLTPDSAQRADRRRNHASGLAASLRLTGTGTQDTLWRRLDEITVPTLVIAGELDDKFTALGQQLVAAIPSSTMEIVEGAGHSVHLERPEATAKLIASWLVQTGLASPAAC